MYAWEYGAPQTRALCLPCACGWSHQGPTLSVVLASTALASPTLATSTVSPTTHVHTAQAPSGHLSAAHRCRMAASALAKPCMHL